MKTKITTLFLMGYMLTCASIYAQSDCDNDVTPPVMIATNVLNVSYDGDGEINLTPDMLDNGSYDDCSDVTLSISESFFTCDNAGIQNVILTGTDASGNSNSTLTTVSLEDKSKPIPYVISNVTSLLTTGVGQSIPSLKIYAEDFNLNSYDNCGIVEMTLSQDEFTCADIGDNEITFTVIDAAGNSDFALVTLTVVDNSNSNELESIVCDNTVLSEFTNLPVTMQPVDILEGEYGCGTNFTLEIKDEDDNVVADNYITSAYSDQVLTATVTELNSGLTCWSTITIVSEDLDCEFEGESDIEWPLELIELNLLGVPSSELTPEYMEMELGLSHGDVLPTIPVECDFVAYAYSDQVFNVNSNLDKILRTFSVINWLSDDAEVYTFTQIIKNTNTATAFICDVLPRSADVGDCESGHSLEDDVEWPNDISIVDPRIAPAELVSFSSVDALDASPSFYGDNMELYSATYQDLIGSLSSELLVINRIWTVTSEVPGDFSWEYAQQVSVDFTDFSSMITVNTFGSRAVPSVQLADDVETDFNGVAFADNSVAINPQLTDAPLNGLDVVDILMMWEQVLGKIHMTDYELEAADINGNGTVSTLDIVLLDRIINGTDTGTDQWSFIDVTSTIGISNRASYVAIKAGDVNDSALLPGESTNLSTSDIYFEDQLLNAGEVYEIPFFSNAQIDAQGVEIKFNYDPTLLTIEDVTSDLFDTKMYYTVDQTLGTLTVIAVDAEETHLLDATEALFTITAKSEENSILHYGLDFHTEHRQYILGENYELYIANGDIQNDISSTNNQNFVEGITVFPNPTSDFINIDLSETTIANDFSVTMYDAAGKRVLVSQNQTSVSVTKLNQGMYIMYLSSGDLYYSQAVSIER